MNSEFLYLPIWFAREAKGFDCPSKFLREELE